MFTGYNYLQYLIYNIKYQRFSQKVIVFEVIKGKYIVLKKNFRNNKKKLIFSNNAQSLFIKCS